MKRSNGIFWGGLLVVMGVVWLLRNMGYLYLDWQEVSRFWPALLILAGLSLLASGGERRGIGGGVAGILIVLAVLGGITHRTERALDRHSNNWGFDWDDDEDWDWDSDRDKDRNRERDRKSDPRGQKYEDDDADSSSSRRGSRNDHYEYDLESGLQQATLKFEGGAGEFKLKGNTNKLFEADTRSSLGGFTSTIRNNRNVGSAEIDFKMENNKVNLKGKNIENSVEFSLSESPIWTIDMGVGAGTADFDLSNFKVKKLKVSTGVADLDLKLGDKLETMDVEIESGVASVTVEVPESVGCEVRLDGALNVKKLDDLVKISDGLYRSPGFEQTSRKIIIRYEAGLSEVKIRRY
ncbi:LiaI-LiaF-like domain-containing protein [Arundinibacter roseus]|uniref:LiaI-LiaF-like transmembrane region domain-containing protein n=1 Tax=Arundinibacter roseus TaxID=2070510 RepID=A0A4R4KJC9_9BACT|nr:DUF5668 domain-containing protein [Arundinibacter roseus]TDB68053.1 hypothetical protein EZE20_03790 [Arundinibacter roseus]